MSDNLHDLGSTVVFDAENMRVGMYVKMGDQLLVISKIEGERVFVEPVTGALLYIHKARKHTKLLAFILLIVVLAISFHIKGIL